MTPAKSLILTCLVMLAVVVASPVAIAGDSFALRARRILPVSPDLPWVIEGGVIVVRAGRIAAIGRDLDLPPDLPVVEFPDGVVVPGFVAAASELGGRHRGDESAAAGYRAVDAFDRYGDFAETLAAGVTTVHLDPGTHRLITGQGAVVKLGGPPADRILRARADLAVNLGPGVNNPPPEVTYPFPASADVAITPPIPQRPASRMGQPLALNEAIEAALAGTRGDPPSIHPPALAQAWNDKLPVRMRADLAADLLAAVRLLRDHQRAGYLVGGLEAHRAADAIREAGVPLVYRPGDPVRALGNDIGTDPNAPDTSASSPRSLQGLQLAVASPVGQPLADLRLAAVRQAHAGLGPQRALEAITRVPAEILGVADRVGSLAPGRDADFLVLTGDPLDVSCHVQRTYIAGRAVFEPPAGGALVVKAAVVWAGPGRQIRDGQILAENGKIVAVGRSVPHPPLARVIDVRPGGFVAPGLIDGHGHLGFLGDRTEVGNDLRLAGLVGVADVTDRRLSAAGVTTVLTAPYRISAMGSPCAVIKTAGSRRDDRVIRDPAAVLFDVRQTDPLAVQETLSKPLDAGKKYLDAWNKYEKDLKEFLEKKAKGQTPQDSQGSKEEEIKTPSGPDPVTGTWEATVSGVPTPEPITLTAGLQLIGSAVEGRVLHSSVGATGRISGTFDGKHLSAEIEVDVPGVDTPPKLEVDLVGEDHFQGTLTVMGITAKIEGRRVDKSPVDLKVVRTRRRTRGKDGRPLPPKVDESLEPLKALWEKKIPAVVNVSTAAQIREVLSLLVEKHQLRVTLLNAEEASVHAKTLAEKKIAVIVPPDVLRQRRYRDYHQADELARRGVPLALQSNAEDGARNLPAVALYAVERGLDAEAALEALTLGAARALKIDDRVGSLEPGKDADLVIFSDHPFLGGGRVLKTVVDGKEVRP
ncbi:MAG: amidohydrolase family protein [Pirellulales bacterium]|nr:amidohydrolase family protein [Pirellulales bacterium]